MKKLLIALCIVLYCLPTTIAAEIGDDGLYKQDWFSITFKDIGEDIEAANENGKRLALIFEQRGCVCCQQMHETVLADPQVRDFVQANFIVVQYNLYGDEEVIDTDNQTLTEKSAARKWGLMFTPTILFMPEKIADNKSAKESAVAIMPGAFRKGTFLDMFTWVHQKGYQTDETFQQFHARSIRERQEKGIKNTD